MLSDIDHLGADSGSFTFVSEAHGTTSWIDHCLCTTQAHASLVGVNIGYGMQSSDHFPLSICIDVKSVPRLESESVPTQCRLNWSKASARDKSAYTDKCAELLGNIMLPREAVCCCNTSCEDGSHIENIQCLYYDIVNSLHTAASDTIPSSKSNSHSVNNITPGWNDFVKAAHSEARDAFKFWIRSSKPRQGEVFDDMKTSRAKFKYLLRQCRRNEASVRADILARELCKKDTKLFWKHVSKQNNSSTSLADTVGGATGRESIASMWSSHYSQLFNCVTCDRHKNYTLDAVKLITNDYDTFNPGDINHSIASLCSNKACGIDVLFAEHLIHASPEIHVLLSICFNAFIVHGFLPNPLTDTVLVPIVKDRTKNISDKGNYRPIALASVVSKVFEMSLRVKLESFLHSSDYQFGFKANHSTDLCIYTLKEVIDYKSQSTSIYVCFMDASKAFDRVNHWLLFKKLIDRGMPLIFVRILMKWYTTQKACVRWGSALSDSFFITNGVRQGGILSPLLFNVYMDALSSSLSNTPIGCSIGGVMVNHIMYADDLAIISPSAKGLQRLLDICADYGQSHDILFNDGKTVCMYMPANSSFYINTPAVFLNGRRLSFTVKYKYLGTLMTHDGSDEANLSRQRGFFMRAAMVYQNISTHVRPLSKLHSLEPSVVICIVATFGMILGRVL